MQKNKLTFSIFVQAPREKTFHVMLSSETYRDWTSAFAAGSYYVGDWTEGSEMLFLAPGENGQESGMVARIRTNRPNEYLSIEHLGMIENGKRDTSSDAVKAWAGAQENYTFRERDGGTEVIVEMDVTEEFQGMFEETWPKALQRLKELAEAKGIRQAS